MLGAREVTMVIGGGRLVLGARWQVYTVEVVRGRHLHGTQSGDLSAINLRLPNFEAGIKSSLQQHR